VALPQARAALAENPLVIVGTILFVISTATLAQVRIFGLLFVAMLFGGLAWMTTMSSFNIGVQTVVPEWVRARALAIYLLSFFGSLAVGSALWGIIAEHFGIPLALLCAASALIVGLLAALFFPLRINEQLDLSPS